MPKSVPLLALFTAVMLTTLTTLTTQTASAESKSDPLWPQLSYSVAVGKSTDGTLGHMWVGAGAHTRTGQFALVGADFDFTDDGAEPWGVLRLGQGAFKRRAMAPMVAVYLLGGVRLDRLRSGRDKSEATKRVTGNGEATTATPTVRIGAGASVPALLQLACIGIPTMIEGGVDLAPAAKEQRWFFRLGWNF